MYNTFSIHNEIIVDLTEKVFVRTIIPKENHAALRSGFAGYPVNPRWNIHKYHAWKIGCQWRDDLNNGKMVVRNEDSMLIPIADLQVKEKKSYQKIPSPRFSLFPKWAC